MKLKHSFRSQSPANTCVSCATPFYLPAFDEEFVMRSWSLTLSCCLVSALFANAPATARGDDVPEGFTPLFNGKDLTGWHGMEQIDPRKFAAMSPEERDSKLDAWTNDAAQHWSVADGAIVNDGHGVFLTTDKEYGDIELLIDYKTGPKGDSGIYLKATPQIQIWDSTKEGGKWNIGADKGSGGLWNNSSGAHQAKICSCWPTSRLASGTTSGSSRSARERPFT